MQRLLLFEEPLFYSCGQQTSVSEGATPWTLEFDGLQRYEDFTASASTHVLQEQTEAAVDTVAWSDESL